MDCACLLNIVNGSDRPGRAKKKLARKVARVLDMDSDQQQQDNEEDIEEVHSQGELSRLVEDEAEEGSEDDDLELPEEVSDDDDGDLPEDQDQDEDQDEDPASAAAAPASATAAPAAPASAAPASAAAASAQHTQANDPFANFNWGNYEPGKFREASRAANDASGSQTKIQLKVRKFAGALLCVVRFNEDDGYNYTPGVGKCIAFVKAFGLTGFHWPDGNGNGRKKLCVHFVFGLVLMLCEAGGVGAQ